MKAHLIFTLASVAFLSSCSDKIDGAWSGRCGVDSYNTKMSCVLSTDNGLLRGVLMYEGAGSPTLTRAMTPNYTMENVVWLGSGVIQGVAVGDEITFTTPGNGVTVALRTWRGKLGKNEIRGTYRDEPTPESIAKGAVVTEGQFALQRRH